MRYAYNTASPDRYKLLRELAEKHKQYPTEAEKCLWQHISKRQLGVKFNRQHVIGDYIVDFVCLEKRLVIEVDGEYHNEAGQTEQDFDRTIQLSRMGFDVIRFCNDEVFSCIDEVLERISKELDTL
jgi:ATP-dependent DNA helicase RecG